MPLARQTNTAPQNEGRMLKRPHFPNTKLLLSIPSTTPVYQCFIKCALTSESQHTVLFLKPLCRLIPVQNYTTYINYTEVSGPVIARCHWECGLYF